MNSEMITTTDEMIESAPDRLLGVEQYIGQPYADVSEQLEQYDWDGWYPVVSDGVYIGIVPADCGDEFVWNESLDVMIPADEAETHYILRDLDGYGNAAPVCVTRESAEELMRGLYATDANAPEFDDVWREADEDDIAEYGKED